MTKPKLYALLVGINKYQKGIKALHGCHNDVKKMRSYLEEQADHFEVDIAFPLLDQDATKTNIVAQFRAHLGKAQARDTALFYFSGHGCREDGDPQIWHKESDRLLEGLICHHPKPQTTGDIRNRVGPEVLLADKELRYLIWELSAKHPKGKEPHLVVISDCCHSGDNTRNVMAQTPGMRSRREEIVAKQRAINQFIFPESWLKQVQVKKGLGGVDYLEGQHVQMAACQPHQLAKEDYLDQKGVGVGNPSEKTGIFTHHLLQFLRQNGNNLSYYDLHTRLKIFTRFRFEQVPQVYVPEQSKGWLYRGFLNRPLSTTPVRMGQVHHDVEKGWVLNLGALHNISRRSSIGVSVGTETLQGKPVEVQPDMSVLEFNAAAEAKLDREQSYPCLLEGLLCEPLNLCIKAEAAYESSVAALQDQLQARVRGLNFIDTVSEGTYTLHLIQGEYRLAQPEVYRPIVQPIKMQQPDAIDELGRCLRQISQWEYVKGLQSEAAERAAFPKGLPLDIRVELQQEDQTFVDWPKQHDELVVLPLRKTPADKWKGKIRIQIKNRYNRPLWVAALYLDTDYSVTTILDEKVKQLGENEKIQLLESPISLKPHFYDYNWANDLSRIKFIVSTQANIEIEQLLMEDGLPLPLVSEDNHRGLNGGFRGLGDEDEEEVNPEEGWMTQELVLQIPNPLHNTISKAKLEAMMQHPVLKEYAKAIYLVPELTLKKGISWNDKTETNA